MIKTIYPCLWFDGKAKEAATFYCSVFENSKIMADTPMVVTCELQGKKFMLLNGGPAHTFNEAVSFVIECDTQEEIDYFWDTFTKEGKENVCGWLKDKYGVSWQIVPSVLGTLMQDPERAPRVMAAFMKMKKFDIAALMNA